MVVSVKNKLIISELLFFSRSLVNSQYLLLITHYLRLKMLKRPLRLRQLHKHTKTFSSPMQRVVFSSAVGRSDNPVGQVVMW